MISTHILDLNLGQPAHGVNVLLEKKSKDSWSLVNESATNTDGRIVFQCPAEAGTYRLIFKTEAYLKKNNITPFFVETPVTFHIIDAGRKYHIPLLLSPYGYSTYRGS